MTTEHKFLQDLIYKMTDSIDECLISHKFKSFQTLAGYQKKEVIEYIAQNLTDEVYENIDLIEELYEQRLANKLDYLNKKAGKIKKYHADNGEIYWT